jgi:hypothetical protein
VRLVTPNAVRSLWNIPLAVQAAMAVASGSSSQSDGDPPVLLPRAPASANATKIAAMETVTRAFPGLSSVWGQGSRSGSVRASDYDRSDALLLAMAGAAYHTEAACIAMPGVFEDAVSAVVPGLLPLRGAKSVTSQQLADRLCELHDINGRSLKGGPISPTPPSVPAPPLPHEETVYALCRAAFLQSVVDALLGEVWLGQTVVIDRGNGKGGPSPSVKKRTAGRSLSSAQT